MKVLEYLLVVGFVRTHTHMAYVQFRIAFIQAILRAANFRLNLHKMASEQKEH